MKLPVWRDETSYAQSDKERVPRVWNIELAELMVLKVYRHINYPGRWLVACIPLEMHLIVLAADTVEEAKREGLKVANKRISYLKTRLDAAQKMVRRLSK
jgi:hypothetical protein